MVCPILFSVTPLFISLRRRCMVWRIKVKGFDMSELLILAYPNNIWARNLVEMVTCLEILGKNNGQNCSYLKIRHFAVFIRAFWI